MQNPQPQRPGHGGSVLGLSVLTWREVVAAASARRARRFVTCSIWQRDIADDLYGRLTLNMLASFAQFEREIAGERIRDKIAASKRKGVDGRQRAARALSH